MLDSSSMVGFPLVIANFEQDMPGNEPGSLGWHTSAQITDLQELSQSDGPEILRCLQLLP